MVITLADAVCIIILIAIISMAVTCWSVEWFKKKDPLWVEIMPRVGKVLTLVIVGVFIFCIVAVLGVRLLAMPLPITVNIN